MEASHCATERALQNATVCVALTASHCPKRALHERAVCEALVRHTYRRLGLQGLSLVFLLWVLGLTETCRPTGGGRQLQVRACSYAHTQRSVRLSARKCNAMESMDGWKEVRVCVCVCAYRCLSVCPSVRPSVRVCMYVCMYLCMYACNVM